ncbi:hypothetical protein CR513_03688, partial [Mucuna pruriens]
MEVTLMKANIHDVVELYHYTSLDNLRSYPYSSDRWKGKYERRGWPRKDKSSKKVSSLARERKENTTPSDQMLGKWHISSQCPNIRIMIGTWRVKVPRKNNRPIARVSLQVSTHLMRVTSSWCHVKGKLCSLIIDGGNSVNVANMRLVENALETLQAIVVEQKRKYSDEILCDVVPTEATYILLGRSLQFHRQKIHDGVTNRFSFVHKGQKVTIKILSPRKVSEYHLQMKIKMEKEQKEIEKVEMVQRKETKKI